MTLFPLDDFLWRALLGGLCVAVIAGPLGCFIIWQRMAYFGSALSHSALLGVALGVLLGVNFNLSTIVVCILMTALLITLQNNHKLSRQLSTDALLGILAHGALALGLVLLAFRQNVRFDLYAYLFGDVLAIANEDLYWFAGGLILVLGTLSVIWKPLLSITIHEELAQVEGIAVKRVRTIYMLLIALSIAIAMKIVGVLLITSLLIIPAAAVRPLSRTPEQMAVFSVVMGCIAVVSGLYSSVQWDMPAGPAIVLAAVIGFIVLQVIPLRR